MYSMNQSNLYCWHPTWNQQRQQGIRERFECSLDRLNTVSWLPCVQNVKTETNLRENRLKIVKKVKPR